MATVTNQSGKDVDFDDAVFYMDDETREEIHMRLAPCTDQEFFTAYEKAHKEKFGEDFELPG